MQMLLWYHQAFYYKFSRTFIVTKVIILTDILVIVFNTFIILFTAVLHTSRVFYKSLGTIYFLSSFLPFLLPPCCLCISSKLKSFLLESQDTHKTQGVQKVMTQDATSQGYASSEQFLSE